MAVITLRYEDLPPDDALIRSALALVDHPYTYFVATTAQERRRAGLTPPHQYDGDKPMLVFHQVLRHLLPPVLTRAEERVAMGRALRAVARDRDHERQLRHDVFAWRDAMAELAACGEDMLLGLSPTRQKQLVNPDVAALLAALQKEYRAAQRAAGRRTFEEEAHTFLARYQPTEIVVFDGFTYLTPLQRRLLDAADERGATVYVIHAYRAAQHRGFAIMDRTYAPYLGTPPGPLASPPDPSASTLTLLQRELFGTTTRAAAAEDGSVTVVAHAHRHDEVAACVARVREYLDAGVRPEEIAIVTRSAAEFQTLLQETADLHGLEITLGVPPRQLLLTPLGRFVLTLYAVWRENALRMDAEQFETLLASGWLGAQAQGSVDAFNACEAQMFARSSTLGEWRARLQLLRAVRPRPGSRLPAAAVAPTTVDLWLEAVEAVDTLCRALFAGDDRPIGGHVERLLDKLNRLLPEEMREAERTVVARIREALLQVAEARSLAMSAEEFGTVLNSLVREYERTSDGTEACEVPGRVWVTTPEGIDGHSVRIVLFLGVDNRRVPRHYAEPWPFYAPEVDRHQELERYLFLAVVRAAREHLWLSYARADDGGTYRPSPYLEEATARLGVSLTAPAVSAQEQERDTAVTLAQPPGRAHRSEYDLVELAHFGLCPWRYKLERLDRRARQYRPEFQVRHAAAALWLHRVYDVLATSGQGSASGAALQAKFATAVNNTEAQVHDVFPGLRGLAWVPVRRTVERDLAYQVQKAGTFPTQVQAVPREAPNISITVVEGDRSVRVDVLVQHIVRRGKIAYPLLDAQLRAEWLLPGRTPRANTPAPGQVGGVPVFADQYAAVQWWRATAEATYFWATRAGRDPGHVASTIQTRYAQARYETAGWIGAIEAGAYPKNPGPHCHFCPVQRDCLGLEP